MPFCSACGTKCADDAKFCSACGKAIGVAPLAEQTSRPTENVAPVIQVIAPAPPLKAFDNPAELWKMFFYVALFDLGIYFLTTSAAENSGDSVGFFLLFFAAYFGLAYFLVKVQAFDKGRAVWLLPLIAFHVWGYLQGIASSGDLEFATTFDNYDTFISGIPELVILIKLFLVLRQGAAK
jgi:zinc-ribbon domain